MRRQAAELAPVEAIDEPEWAPLVGSEALGEHELGGPAEEPELDIAEEPPAAAPAGPEPGTAASSLKLEPETAAGASVEPELETAEEPPAAAPPEPEPGTAAAPLEPEPTTVEPETAAGPIEPDAERGVTSARLADPAASRDTASPLAPADGGASRPADPEEETGAARTLAQSRRHLEARTDEQLAQTYEETRQAVELAQQQNDRATAEHFSAINRATVQEAARRPDFGTEVHERAARMWFRRGRRSRAFDELEAARRELLEEDGE